MTRRRVDLVAPPMSGHLHPILGIARRLAAEVDVRVISTAGAQAEIAAAGLQGCALMAGADALIASIVNPPKPVQSNPLRLHRQFTDNLRLLTKFRGELLALWQDDRPDLVIADFVVPVAGSAAIERGIPWWTSAPSPCALEAPDGPPGYLGGWRPRSGALWRARDAAGRATIRLFKRAVHRRHRATLTALGFPSVYRSDGYEAIYSPDCILGLGLEALEFPRRVSPAVRWVGPVMYTPPSDAPSPLFVPDRTHVLVTMGTHLPWRRQAMWQAVRHAAREMPTIEFHVSDGDRHSDRCEVDGNVRRLGFVSYARDLPRYAAVVHHGGAGVMYRALAAGIPAVVVPADYDQFDNAARLDVAGVAVWSDLRNLSQSIGRALTDQAIRSQCRRMQAHLVGVISAPDRVADLVSRIFER